MRYFDSHCHLYMSQFAADKAEVLARMQEGGVGGVIIGTNLEESKQALELATQYYFLWASVGLHPNESEQWLDISSQMEELANHQKVVAIGECGLDYFRSAGEGQKERFLAQIDLAERVGKPLIIHCRDAHDDVLAILTERNPAVPVVMHFFTGSGELAQKYLDLGCYLSFPGPITYTDMYDDSIRTCPLDKLLVETDAPFAAPVPNRGKRNEPVFVKEVISKIAAVKGVSVEEVAAATVANATKVFALPN